MRHRMLSNLAVFIGVALFFVGFFSMAFEIFTPGEYLALLIGGVGFGVVGLYLDPKDGRN